jgi:hypothetical protein
MTHGFALALLAILCAMKSLGSTRRIGWTQSCGLALGFTFLTKPEIFIAAAAACAVGLTLSRKGLVAYAIVFLTTLLAPCLGLVIFGKAAFGAWRWVFDPALVDQHFYKIVRGTEDAGKSIALIATIATGCVIVLGIPIAIAMFCRPKRPALVSGAMFALVAISLFLMRSVIDWAEIGRPLVVITLVVLIVLLMRIAKPEAAKGDASRASSLIFAIFALALLPKIALHVVLYHYGFALAAPALVLTIVALVSWIPKWFDSRGGCGTIARFGALGALLVLGAMYVSFSHERYKQKTITVGTGADAFYTDLRGQSVNEILEELPKDKTLAVVPQGAMINFLARRENPTPFVVLMPPEVIMFGDDAMLDAYKNHPPDLLLILGMDLGEYGYKSFPQYAPKLGAWIDGNYTTVMRGEAKALRWRLLRANSTEESTPAHR